MRRSSELEVSDRIVLVCESCGECGAKLALADRVGDAILALAELMRGPWTTEREV